MQREMEQNTNDDKNNKMNNNNDNKEKNTKEGEYYQQHGKPYEGMCCLCTMEDITEQDGNYGERCAMWCGGLLHANIYL